MTESLHIDMHRDHMLWKAETVQWRDDLEFWKNELTRAETQLKDLQKALNVHRDALSAHAASIMKREQEANAHEYAIASYEMGGTGEELPAMAVKHNDEEQEQAKQRSAHDRIRRHHHTIIANYSLLLKAIQQPM